MTGKDKIQAIKNSKDKWEANNPEEPGKQFMTEEGIPIKRVYTPLDLEEKGFDYLRDLGFPGEYPFTRGSAPSMYRSKPWRFLVDIGYATPEELNQALKRLISEGANAFDFIHDLPSQCGYDPDHPLAIDEPGRVGTPFYSLRDWEIATEGIDLSEIFVENNSNCQATVVIANHLAAGEKQGIDVRSVYGGVQNDFLKEICTRGNYIFPLEPSMRLCCDAIIYCAEHAPQYYAVMPMAYHWSEAGADRVQEGAYTISAAIAYLEVITKRRYNVDKVGSEIWFIGDYQHDGFFEEIAKIRAMRRVWARVMKERFNAKVARTMQCCFWSKFSGSCLTKEQYLNNAARSAIGTVAALLAGVEMSSHTTVVEALGIPNHLANVLGLRGSQIGVYETGITKTVDPLAGSYFVESLTSEYEERIMAEIKKIDALGGMVRAVEEGYVQRNLIKSAEERFKRIQSGETIRVGVNRFCGPSPELSEIPVYRPDPRVYEERMEKVRAFKESRNNAAVARALDEVRRVAEKPESNDNNLMLPIIKSVKSYATVGEIIGAMKEVFGEYRETGAF